MMKQLKTLADTDANVSARVQAIVRDIRSVLAVSPIDLTALGGQIQALVKCACCYIVILLCNR